MVSILEPMCENNSLYLDDGELSCFHLSKLWNSTSIPSCQYWPPINRFLKLCFIDEGWRGKLTISYLNIWSNLIIFNYIQADLNPLFNWNVKQLFLYLTAEYQTPNNKLNQVILEWIKTNVFNLGSINLDCNTWVECPRLCCGTRLFLGVKTLC